MYRKILMILAFSILVISCDKVDEGIIPKDDMVSIYTEMFVSDHLAESVPEYRGKTDSMYLYVSVFEKYGYTSEQYMASVDYYLRNVDDFVDILETVKVRLTEESDVSQDSLSRVMSRRKLDLDSLEVSPSSDDGSEEVLSVIKQMTKPETTEHKMDVKELRKMKKKKRL